MFYASSIIRIKFDNSLLIGGLLCHRFPIQNILINIFNLIGFSLSSLVVIFNVLTPQYRYGKIENQLIDVIIQYFLTFNSFDGKILKIYRIKLTQILYFCKKKIRCYKYNLFEKTKSS